jgi:hyperosmotically inducible protein
MNTRIATLPTIALASILSLGLASIATAQVSAAPNNEANTESDQPVTDTWITTKVKTELATTDGVKSMDINVETVDGVVSLIGVLESDVAVKKAIAAAQSVKGVKTVDSSGLKTK